MTAGACARLSLSAGSEVSRYAASQHVIADAKGNVLRFYGVPMNLAISQVQKLSYSVEIGEEVEEGLRRPLP